MISSKITYCSNIHPIKGFEDVLLFLREKTSWIAKNYSNTPFPIGLWYPEFALQEAFKPENVKKINALLDQHQLFVITFNAFPQHNFHKTPVKEKVYQPDWAETARLNYSKKVAKYAQLIGLKEVTLSTLSGGFKSRDTKEKRLLFLKHWFQWVRWAEEFEASTGCRAILALEPEPFNTLEDEDDIIKLWEEIENFCSKRGLDRHLLNRYLGICLDTCHFSVRFKSPSKSYQILIDHQIPIHKVQLSIAPRWKTSMGQQALNTFFDYQEPIYLHQSFGKTSDGSIHEYLDLPIAKRSKLKAIEWRTHFHIPINWSHQNNTTGKDLIDFINVIKEEDNHPILEIETYTFHAMEDDAYTANTVEESILKELQWLREQFKS